MTSNKTGPGREGWGGEVKHIRGDHTQILMSAGSCGNTAPDTARVCGWRQVTAPRPMRRRQGSC